MPLLTRDRIAVAFALPALLVPLIEIPLVLWARFTFISLHPEYYADPPTISRAIDDPLVGTPFAQLILVITVLILVMLPILIRSYSQSISRLNLSAGLRTVMYVMLTLILLLQLVASAGMIMTTQFTFSIDHDKHMLGSYIFFCSQALTIVLAASLCRILLHQKARHGITDEDWNFRPVMHRIRFLFGMLIMSLVVAYGILFKIRNFEIPVSAYFLQLLYTQCEVLVIACYVLFLGSYAVDIYYMVRQGRLWQTGPDLYRPAPAGEAAVSASGAMNGAISTEKNTQQ